MIKKIITISIILSFVYTNSQGLDNKTKFNSIKGDYLISYYINGEKDIKRYDITPIIFYHKGYVYSIIFQDYITNYIPIDAYNFHKITNNNFNKLILYFNNLAKSKPDYGKYQEAPTNYLIIEGRYKNKPFIIKISDISNKYISDNVTRENLINRESTIKKLYQNYDEIKAKIFTPKSYFILYKKANINSNESNSYPELNIDKEPGCYFERSLTSDFNGIYRNTNNTGNNFYMIYNKPNLTGINLCEE